MLYHDPDVPHLGRGLSWQPGWSRPDSQIPITSIQVKGHDFFAWCALDTVFLSIFIGEPAFIKSKCPLTGGTIELTVSPHGIETFSPPDTVMSIAIPGISSSLDITGPQSDTCSQMHLFSSRSAAEIWLVDHPGVEILTIEETW